MYTDGHHVKGTKELGFGLYAKYQEQEYTLAQPVSEEWVRSHGLQYPLSNPTMELAAVECLLDLLDISSLRNFSVTVYSDYEGVQKWLSGEWTAKATNIKILVKRCLNSLKELQKKGVTVRFLWVKGHSESEGNRGADRASKMQVEMDTLSLLFSLLS